MQLCATLKLPATRAGGRRLGLVTLPQILNALLWAVDNPSRDVQILDVPRIKEFRRECQE